MFKHVDHGKLIESITRETTEKGRMYFTPSGATYPSVTTVLSIQDKSGIEEWRQKVGAEEADKILRQAGIRGTAVHDMAEKYLKNDSTWAQGYLPNNIFTFQQLKPIIDTRINNIWFQETFIWSDYLKTAGQVDLIAEFDGILSIIDFKTSRKKKEKDWIKGYFMQEAFYAVAFEERTSKPIKQCVTLIAVDGDDPQIFIEDRDSHIKDFMRVRSQFFKLRGY